MAGAGLGVVGFVGWMAGVVGGKVEVWVLAAGVGAVGMVFGGGMEGVFECAVAIGVALVAGWATGLINAVELMSELGLGGLTVAGS